MRDDQYGGWVAKYGVQLVSTVSIIVTLMGASLVVANSVGKLDAIVQNTVRRVDSLEDRQCKFPEQYVTRQEHQDLKNFINTITDRRDKSDAYLAACLQRVENKVDDLAKEMRTKR